MNNADFVNTFADIEQTLNRLYEDYYTRMYLTQFSFIIKGKSLYCALIFVGPTWCQMD